MSKANMFGMTLKGLMLGFYWSEKRQGFVRISFFSDDKYKLEFIPPKIKYMKPLKGKFYVLSDLDVDLMLDKSPVFKKTFKIKDPMVLFLNENGEVTK